MNFTKALAEIERFKEEKHRLEFWVADGIEKSGHLLRLLQRLEVITDIDYKKILRIGDKIWARV